MTKKARDRGLGIGHARASGFCLVMNQHIADQIHPVLQLLDLLGCFRKVHLDEVAKEVAWRRRATPLRDVFREFEDWVHILLTGRDDPTLVNPDSHGYHVLRMPHAISPQAHGFEQNHHSLPVNAQPRPGVFRNHGRGNQIVQACGTREIALRLAMADAHVQPRRAAAHPKKMEETRGALCFDHGSQPTAVSSSRLTVSPTRNTPPATIRAVAPP